MKILRWVFFVVGLLFVYLAWQFLMMLAGGFGEVRGEVGRECESGDPVIANGIEWGCVGDPYESYQQVLWMPSYDEGDYYSSNRNQ